LAKTKGARDADYAAKRAALLQRLRARLTRPDETRPSLRALAEAAGVSVATLRHYFGGRAEVLEAVMEGSAQEGRPYVDRAALPQGPFAESVRAWLREAAFGLRRTALGDLLAAGMAEGMLDGRLGPACVEHLLEPTLTALAERLRAHQAAGEMRPADPRHAALMLFAPLLLACQHQDQLGGRARRPLDLDAFMEAHARAFVEAFGVRTEGAPRV